MNQLNPCIGVRNNGVQTLYLVCIFCSGNRLILGFFPFLSVTCDVYPV